MDVVPITSTPKLVFSKETIRNLTETFSTENPVESTTFGTSMPPTTCVTHCCNTCLCAAVDPD